MEAVVAPSMARNMFAKKPLRRRIKPRNGEHLARVLAEGGARSILGRGERRPGERITSRWQGSASS